jgi:hypothetical protein
MQPKKRTLGSASLVPSSCTKEKSDKGKRIFKKECKTYKNNKTCATICKD